MIKWIKHHWIGFKVWLSGERMPLTKQAFEDVCHRPSTLSVTFTWQKTPQGHAYWRDIAHGKASHHGPIYKLSWFDRQYLKPLKG